MQIFFMLPTYLPYFFLRPLQETNNIFLLALVD